MKTTITILSFLIGLTTLAQTSQPDTLNLYDAYCEANNPHEIDTTIFSYGYDTLYIRNIHNAFCSSEFYRAVVQNETDTLKIDIVNVAGGADCLADCSMGYTIKIPLASFDTLNLKIIDEYFTINKADISMFDQKEFAPIGAEWYYNERFAFSGDIDFIKFTSEKDTIIHGKTCKKITKRHKIYCFDRPDAEYLYTSNDTVYFFDTTFNEFQNLYVFNSAPNDSWVIKIKDEAQEIDTITITVDSISTKQINGQNLKVLYVNYDKDDENFPESYSSTIIEKIGDANYMFNWYPWSLIVCDANWTDGLRCYQDSKIGLYSTGIVDSCNYIYKWTGVNIKKQKEKILVFPNPVNDYLFIETDLKTDLIAELHSLDGKILISKVFNESAKLDLSGIIKGAYILNIRNRNKIIETKKIMK